MPFWRYASSVCLPSSLCIPHGCREIFEALHSPSTSSRFFPAWSYLQSHLSVTSLPPSRPHPFLDPWPLYPVILNVWSPDEQHQRQLGACQRCKFSGPTPNLLNQKLCGWGRAIIVSTSSAGVPMLTKFETTELAKLVSYILFPVNIPSYKSLPTHCFRTCISPRFLPLGLKATQHRVKKSSFELDFAF